MCAIVEWPLHCRRAGDESISCLPQCMEFNYSSTTWTVPLAFSPTKSAKLMIGALVFLKGAKFSPFVDSRRAVILVGMSIAWTFRSLSVVWSVSGVSVMSRGRAEKRAWGRAKGARRGNVGRRNLRPQFSLLPRPPSTTESMVTLTIMIGWKRSFINYI